MYEVPQEVMYIKFIVFRLYCELSSLAIMFLFVGQFYIVNIMICEI